MTLLSTEEDLSVMPVFVSLFTHEKQSNPVSRSAVILTMILCYKALIIKNKQLKLLKNNVIFIALTGIIYKIVSKTVCSIAKLGCLSDVNIYYVKIDEKMKYFSILLLCVIFTYSCENDYVKSWTLIRTGEVTGIDTSGAWFNGLITNETEDSITDHGFVWGFASQPVLPGSFNISLGALEGKKSFKAFITQDKLEAGPQIYIRAYIKTAKYVSYGAQVIFTYPESGLTPEITDVLPDSVFWGNSLTIKGKNFSFLRDKISVQFRMFSGEDGYVSISVNSFTKTSIVATIIPFPSGKTDLGSTSDLFVIIDNKPSLTFPVHFRAPIITSVSPSSGFISQSITVNGYNLGHPFINYEVTLGGVNCPILQTGTGFLKVQVPDAPSSGLKPLSVKFLDMTTSKENAYTVIPPEITSFSPKSGPASVFVRVNFINAPAGYKIYVGNVQVTPLPSSGTNFANFYVPVLPPGEYEVKISYYSLYHIAVDKFTVI
jgi:hypothetical protein